MYALVQLVAFGGQVIILPELFDMDIGALARAKCVVLQGGDGDWVVHLLYHSCGKYQGIRFRSFSLPCHILRT